MRSSRQDNGHVLRSTQNYGSTGVEDYEMGYWFHIALIAPSAIIFSLMIALTLQLIVFRKRYPVIRDDSDMRAFKRLATVQMYGSLPVIYLAWLPIIVWVVGKFIFGHLTWLDGLLFVILPFAALIAWSFAAIGTADGARETPAESETLTTERDRVVDVWVNKNFPEW